MDLIGVRVENKAFRRVPVNPCFIETYHFEQHIFFYTFAFCIYSQQCFCCTIVTGFPLLFIYMFWFVCCGEKNKQKKTKQNLNLVESFVIVTWCCFPFVPQPYCSLHIQAMAQSANCCMGLPIPSIFIVLFIFSVFFIFFLQKIVLLTDAHFDWKILGSR